MNRIKFAAMPSDEARVFWKGGADAYGSAPERKTSGGSGVPCRHCLRDVVEGEAYLILAYRPFPKLQPYAETGPISYMRSPASVPPIRPIRRPC
jgi:hypothetical protein